MTDLSHLDALRTRLSHERSYLAAAKKDSERKLRMVWIAGIEKEIASELKFLGITESDEIEMSDDELLAELMA